MEELRAPGCFLPPLFLFFHVRQKSDLSALCLKHVLPRSSVLDGERKGRLDGDFTDTTNNFLTQRYCNSGEETGSSPFYPMNQHDPISA